ncbi:hypothetical protein MVEN_02464600 [Mycena venus]|uniref:Cytochrome P450 n=1 Tax=Mycena venus TaxID=2733690 RepID=A0A8H7CBL9_9AGAR|nr:hypothetical protein MVEN_02464600 [Mycena venus]
MSCGICLKYTRLGTLGTGFTRWLIVWALFNLELLGQTHIFTVCPEHIQIFLATDFDNYVKGPRGTVYNYMDAATEFLFGTCVDSLSAVLPYPHSTSSVTPIPQSQRANDFPTAFDDAMRRIAFRGRVGWPWPLLEVFGDRTAKSMKTVRAFVEPNIHNAVEKKKRNSRVRILNFEGADTEDNDTLFDELLKSTIDPELLMYETYVGCSFSARANKFASTISLLEEGTMHTLTPIYFLAMYPKVMSRLRDEILNTVGPSERPSYDDIREIKHLRAKHYDFIRLCKYLAFATGNRTHKFSFCPFNVRETVGATTWPSPNPNEKPIYLPAGVKVPYSVMIMQRRADLRMGGRTKYIVPNPFIFLPFNGGPRICLGQQFAYNEISFVIIRLLQWFSSILLDAEACPPHGRVPSDWTGKPGKKGVENSDLAHT